MGQLIFDLKSFLVVIQATFFKNQKISQCREKLVGISEIYYNFERITRSGNIRYLEIHCLF